MNEAQQGVPDLLMQMKGCLRNSGASYCHVVLRETEVPFGSPD